MNGVGINVASKYAKWCIFQPAFSRKLGVKHFVYSECEGRMHDGWNITRTTLAICMHAPESNMTPEKKRFTCFIRGTAVPTATTK
jgi:hypothetical protein